MKNEKRYQTICEMLQAYDQATGNRGADHVIKHPDQWIGNIYQPFYASAAALIIEARESMDKTGSANKNIIPALKRILKNSASQNMDHLTGIFESTDPDGVKRYNACDGHRLVRLYEDISSLPHMDQGRGLPSDSVNEIVKGALDLRLDEELTLPTVQELKTYIAEYKARNKGKHLTLAGKEPFIFHLDNYIYVNPQSLLDMLQALPGCKAYKPKNLKSPIYFTADNGDGVLCPVVPPTGARNKAA